MMYRKYTQLSNGQVAMLQAKRTHNFSGHETWVVAIAIGDTRKVCRQTFRGQYARKGASFSSTGRCGLEGMRAIKTLLVGFEEWVMGAGCMVNIACFPYDEKRKAAYRYLTRMGYQWYNETEGYWKEGWWV